MIPRKTLPDTQIFPHLNPSPHQIPAYFNAIFNDYEKKFSVRGKNGVGIGGVGFFL